jgi:hypothetical protein
MIPDPRPLAEVPQSTHGPGWFTANRLAAWAAGALLGDYAGDGPPRRSVIEDSGVCHSPRYLHRSTNYTVRASGRATSRHERAVGHCPYSFPNSTYERAVARAPTSVETSCVPAVVARPDRSQFSFARPSSLYDRLALRPRAIPATPLLEDVTDGV